MSSTKQAEREFDQTSLRRGGAGRTVHRDYMAHFFRWQYALRVMQDMQKKSWLGRKPRVLDVGCGVDLPFMYVMTRNVGTIPASYLGVDMNKVKFSGSPKWAQVEGGFNFSRDWKKLLKKHGQHDLVINFEVIEHMTVPNGRKLLRGLHGMVKISGVVLLSTPAFSGKAAANHIHEYTIPELEREIVKAGFEVEQRQGTFMQVPKLKKAMKDKAHRQLFSELSRYYHNEALSVIFAPLYADEASNNIWTLRRK